MRTRSIQRGAITGLAAVLLVSASFMSFSARASAGTFPGVNGRLLITDITGPAYHFTSVKPDGTDQKSLPTDGISKLDVEYSPDGTRIAYSESISSVQQVFVANADGTSPLQLTSGVVNTYTPSWSPDGTKILYVQSVSGAKRIFRMNADGSSQTQLTSTSPYSDPEYSPDGTKIVAVLEGSDDEIVVMNADGSNIVALTNNSVVDGTASWSPDGTKLIFSRGVSGFLQIFTMNSDGSSQTQITTAGGGYHNPQYSPDGTKIVYIDNAAPSQMYVANADGTNITPIAVGWPREVSWQTLTHLPSSTTPNPTVSTAGGKATVNVPSMYTDTYEGIDKATVAVTSTPTSGTTSVDTTTGIITYTAKTIAAHSSFWSNLSSVFFPKASAAATDSFTYRVCSLASSSLCSTGTVTVNLLGVPDTGAGQPGSTSYHAWGLAALSVTSIGLGIRKLRHKHNRA